MFYGNENSSNNLIEFKVVMKSYNNQRITAKGKRFTLVHYRN